MDNFYQHLFCGFKSRATFQVWLLFETDAVDLDVDHQPDDAISVLMKLSFDEEYRQAICCSGEKILEHLLLYRSLLSSCLISVIWAGVA